MPFYDRICPVCGTARIDCFEPIVPTDVPKCEQCATNMVRAWLTPPRVIGDFCDVTVEHGLCNPDGSPRRYLSKSEMAAEAKKRGLVNVVEHKGRQGGDTSEHTTRWV